MANDCIVMKLKGSVDGQYPVFNKIRFKVNADNNDLQMGIGPVTGESIKVTCESGVSFSDDTLEKTFTTTTSVIFKGNGYVTLSGKYATKTFMAISNGSTGSCELTAQDLSYMSIETLALNRIYAGKIEDIYMSSVIMLRLASNKTITGDIVAFAARNPNIETINCNTSNSSLIGNVEGLGACIKLTLIDGFLTSLSGDAKTMCDSMVANGRVSGTLQIAHCHQTTSVKWDGNPIGGDKTITFTSEGYTVA